MPAAFGSTTLRALNLSFNAIADFAAGASNLSNLTVLYASSSPFFLRFSRV